MDLERGFLSSSCASAPGYAAEDALDADRMEMEAAEILAALANSKKRVAVTVSAEFAAKWGCKGKRVRKRASTRSESPPSDVGSNPVQSVSDLAEQVQATAGQEQSQVTSPTVVIEPVEAESLNRSHPCAVRCTSNGVVRSRQNVTEILFSTVGMPEKDIWEVSPQDEMTGSNALKKPVKAEQNAESVKSSPTCAAKHMSGGGGRLRQNLTEAEKEARRLRRILANRESARQTIRRRQALCEKLTLKITDLTQENENLKRAKELALNEYQSQESTNKHLKAEMAKAMKADEGKTTAEVALDHQISGPSNYPYFFYNQHPFPPFCWPSIVRSSHPVRSQCGHQNATFVPSSISSLTDGTLDSSHYQESTINVNGPKTALYVLPYPWFFPLPDHRSGPHPHFSCGLKDIEDETSVNNRFSAGCSVSNDEKYNSPLPVEVEKEAYGSIESSPNNLNRTPVRLPSDGGGQCMLHVKEEVLVPTPFCSAGTAFVVEQENTMDRVINTKEALTRAFHCRCALPEENQESTNYTSKKVLDAVAAAEARKRRKELTKLKNLHGRQRTSLSLLAKT